MEYGRRRRRKAYRTSKSRMGSDASSGAGRAMIVLLMIAAIVYLVSASAAGTWLAEHVMAPAFEALASYTGKEAPIEDTPVEDVQQVSLSTDGSSVSANIALPALDCYALQMGVFSSQDNAEKQAQALQGQGAGGYVLQDGDRYRVLAAGYAQEAEAKEVKDRLVNEGMDCT
ncbi:MAG: SPOR domain-containing protein, partial [Clostridia bacterium]|nr:SPOR domain-containing protein [Clostridia bacterium]